MKSTLLLFAIAICVVSTAFAAENAKDGGAEVLRKADLAKGSFPQPFTAFPAINTVNNNRPAKTQPAVSTGYYIVDSDDEAGDAWRPDLFKAYLDKDSETDPAEVVKWKRIVSGPNQIVDAQDLADNGKMFFRNPNALTDSTDDAIAGPIKIGFPFFFNGVRYDSFYVSTNGLIALSNRRYSYDASGNRTIPAGSSDSYNFYREENVDASSYVARPKIGDGLSDNTADDYGYQYVATGNTATPKGGIRNPANTSLTGVPNDMRFSPIIAALWTDLQLSQHQNLDDADKGQVWFKRADNPDGTRRLVIFYKNVSLMGAKTTRAGTETFPKDDRRILIDFQVTLDESDSSVYIYYRSLAGSIVKSNIPIGASELLRMNSTIGVKGNARHYSYKNPNCSSNLSQPEYLTSYAQSTQYLANADFPGNSVNVAGPVGSGASTPQTGLAIRFKQWKNVLRVVGQPTYLGRELNPTASLDAYTRVITGTNIELLAGHAQLGAIRPVAVFQNLTNDIQGPGLANPLRPAGVNYSKQDVNFRTRFRIVNQATGQTAYSESVPIGMSCLQGFCPGTTATVDYVSGSSFTVPSTGGNFPYNNGSCPLNGVPPYGMVRVNFPAFQPNELIDFHIGRLRALVIAEPVDTLFRSLGDQWPFDDTVKQDIFVMRRLSFLNSDGFNDDVTQFHIINGTAMPSVLKWVNIDGEVSDGEENTYNPVPPRGSYPAANKANQRVNSPVIRLNRKTLSGDEPTTPAKGDELRSFPIDVRDLPNRPTKNAVLSFSYQRTGKANGDLGRGWSDALLVGPEPRVLYNDPPGGTTTYGPAPDEFYLEFARPSADEIENIAKQSTSDITWNIHKRRDGQTITGNPVLTLFGAGGLRRGFLENKPATVDYISKDSALTAAQGLRANKYDDGKDWEYSKYFFFLPDSLIYSPSLGAKNFRFRFRVSAVNNQSTPLQPKDDDDDFFIDNVHLIYSQESADVEMELCEVNWPYTVTPASQATTMPIRFKISNNSNKVSATVTVKVRIYQEQWLNSDEITKQVNAVYCNSTPLPAIYPGQEINSSVPAWNARRSPPGRYVIEGRATVQGGDLDNTNDLNYSIFTLNYGPVFAYDPTAARNDVPDFATAALGRQFVGKGLNMFGYAEGLWPHAGGDIVDGRYAFGPEAGNGSGQIAVKFTLIRQDSIKGFQTWFGGLNQSPDPISFSIYKDAGGQPGANPIFLKPGEKALIRQRGYDDVRKDLFYDEYTTYLLDKPIVLEPGDYWISCAQLGFDGYCLGASKARVGQIITNYSDLPPGTYGLSGTHLNLDKRFRQDNGFKQLINNNLFAYENTRFSGTWNQFMPSIGNPAFGHLNHAGGASIAGYQTRSRGTWLPMLRPYLGDKTYSETPLFDENCLTPVELTYFDGQKRQSGVDLFWHTASEENNSGFHVERRAIGGVGTEGQWSSIIFIGGHGTTSAENDYSYTDNSVRLGNTYQYRLMQVDMNGTESCKQISDILEFTFDGNTEVALGQSNPNPFSTSTNIEFALQDKSMVKLDIIDVFGNVVTTLINAEQTSGSHSVTWNGTDAQGNPVASGTYIYRLSAGNHVLNGKMTLSK
ncbi:MAG: T9SS type A sorting domain-containing protein [Bacteroidetes bacterium]|nr:T9SS type A sorting domain-containing protein [Bacteroidota bacterium]